MTVLSTCSICCDDTADQDSYQTITEASFVAQLSQFLVDLDLA